MTFGIQGYPDFVRRQAATDELFLSLSGVTTAANDHRGPFPVGNIGSTFLRLAAHTANVQVQLNYHIDQALTQFVDQHTIICRDSAPFARALAPIAPWADVLIQSNVAGAATYDLRMGVMRELAVALADVTKTVIASKKGVAIGAGTTIDEFAQATVMGRVEMVIACTAATWDVDVSAQNLDGTGYNLLTTTQAEGARQFRTLYVPPRTLRVRIHNSSGAGGTYDLYLMATTDPT